MASSNLNSLSFFAYEDAQQHKDDDVHMKYVQTLEKIRCLFNHEDCNSLSLIDVIQRLGLDHHFAKEIRDVLGRHHHNFSHEGWISSSHDLYVVSLGFRLLRQASFPITQDVFTSFMCDNGAKKFKNDYREDIKGLLALYEASHLGFEGEDILEEASIFSTRNLCANTVKIHDDWQHPTIQYTLKNPCHISVARVVVAKDLIENYVREKEWVTLFQDLARMERAVVGALFQQEVVQVVNWWNGLDLTKELESARDQPMKWHMWSMFVLLNPSMSWQRVLLTKPVSLVYIIDDIFDLYGTLDQLNLFTQAIKRWDFCETEGLPNYMKMCVTAVIETTQEISHIIHQKHGFNPLEILKRSWEKLFDAFLTEAKWFASGNLPKADEYLRNGVVSTGVPMALCHLFFILGDDILNNIEIQEMLNEDHDSITYLVAMILRLYDDLGDAQDEEQNGHDGSYLNCYVKEFEISSFEAGKKHVMDMISKTWKKLNQCSLCGRNPFPTTFTEACQNVVRMVPIIYDKGHEDESNALKEYLLLNP